MKDTKAIEILMENVEQNRELYEYYILEGNAMPTAVVDAFQEWYKSAIKLFYIVVGEQDATFQSFKSAYVANKDQTTYKLYLSLQADYTILLEKVKQHIQKKLNSQLVYIMKISEYAINQIAKQVNAILTGSEWVTFFNSFGARDVYDRELGLPDIGKRNGQRPSKKEYVEHRLNIINNTAAMYGAIIRIATFNEYMSDILNEILRPEHYEVDIQNGEPVIIGGIVENEAPVINQAHFQDIQNQILRELDWAKVSIHVAVAWITNEVLVRKLKDKYKEGLDVRVAYYDDGVNARSGVNFGEIPVFPIRGLRGGVMHNKFCVLDNQHVITGSYNWSNNAEFRNDENITIEHDPERATQYSLEFRRLIECK